jgi:pimeloyl-ACP methyl ester carboxylesterase
MSLLDRPWTRAALVAAAAAGCSAEPPPAAATTTADATAPAELDAIARRATFAPCAEDPELECGQLDVPVDYADPHGPRVPLATVRARALGAHRRGIVFVNPGGPGGSGVDLVILAKALFAPVREEFDVVSFDPRGTNRSQDASCTFTLPPPPTDDSLAAAAVVADEIGARFARACHDQRGPLATQVGTDNVARDIDAFRAALGEREVNYLGFSYGTALGTAYATLFPDRVRAMVLDGNVPPGWFADYLLELDADGSAGAELALRRLDQLCRAAADCPLRTAGVLATYDRVVDRLNRNPVVQADGVITGASVLQLVFSALYVERAWPIIVRVLAAADAGDTTALPVLPTGGDGTVTVPSTFAIVCDDSATRRLGLDYLPAQTATQAIYPRFGGANFGVGVTLCSQWPVTRVAPVRNLRTRHPIVLIGNDFDPATPAAWTRNLASALGPSARVLRYQGGGHTSFAAGSACIDDAVATYLHDLTPPPVGTTCAAQPLAFGPRPAARAARDDANLPEILQRLTPRAPILPRRP